MFADLYNNFIVRKKIVYFDNAATTFPKPDVFFDSFFDFYKNKGGNPGRSGHTLSIAAGEVVEDAREAIAKLFNVTDPFRIAFTYNASYALNLIIMGFLEEGDHVIATPLEHNSVSRPLRNLERIGFITLEILKADPESGIVDLKDLEKKLKEKKTKLTCVVHGSNVSGTVQPLKEIIEICHTFDSYVMVDAAQTAGTYPIDLEYLEVDFLAFTGHKGLFGPQGIGGLYVRPGLDLRIILCGGTGSKSEEDIQPEFMPDRLEIGTPNAGGLASFAAGVRFVMDKRVENIHKYENELVRIMIEGLSDIEGVRVIAKKAEERTPVVSFQIEGLTVSEVGYRLDKEFGICTRVGLHCAPWAHKTFNTFPEGTVRASLSLFNTREEVDYFLNAVKEIAGSRKKG